MGEGMAVPSGFGETTSCLVTPRLAVPGRTTPTRPAAPLGMFEQV